MDKIPAPPQATEQLKGFDFKPIEDSATFFQYKTAIEDLEWDPGDKSEGRIKTLERIPDLKKLYLQSLNKNNRLKLFLIMDGEKLDGFAAIKIDAQDQVGKRLGTITHLWLSERRRQGGTLLDVLDSAEKRMRAEGCTDGNINAPHALSTFLRVGAHTKPSNFFEFTGAANDNEKSKSRDASERKVA